MELQLERVALQRELNPHEKKLYTVKNEQVNWGRCDESKLFTWSWSEWNASILQSEKTKKILKVYRKRKQFLQKKTKAVKIGTQNTVKTS